MTYTGRPLLLWVFMQATAFFRWVLGRAATKVALLRKPVAPGVKSTVQLVHSTEWLTRTGGTVEDVLPIVTRTTSPGTSCLKLAMEMGSRQPGAVLPHAWAPMALVG